MPPDHGGAPVPTGRAARLLRFGGIASGIADGAAAGGLRALASGRRPDLTQLLLTPANTLRLTDGLSHLRGAALKLGQMLSMDTGLVLPEDPRQINRRSDLTFGPLPMTAMLSMRVARKPAALEAVA